MDTMILKEPGISPTKKVLENALGKSYSAYQQLMTLVTAKEYDLTPQWRYYNDGKAWLCKVQFKNKTVFWLSVFEKYFKTTFYFTEKACDGIKDLAIDEDIKKDFSRRKPSGKLHPLTINVNNGSRLNDVVKLIEYKKTLK